MLFRVFRPSFILLRNSCPIWIFQINVILTSKIQNGRCAVSKWLTGIGKRQTCWKNYDAYKGSVRVLFSNKCLAQVTLNKFQTHSNYFNLSDSEAISSYFGLSQSISVHLVISQDNLGYIGLSGSIIEYELWNINSQV